VGEGTEGASNGKESDLTKLLDSMLGDLLAADDGSGDGSLGRAVGDIPEPMRADLEAKELWYEGVPDEWGRKFTTVGVGYAQDEQGNIQRLVSMNSNSMDRWGSGVQNLLGEGDTWVPLTRGRFTRRAEPTTICRCK